MANTTIQIKRSGTSSSTPSVLDYGELALNYADGKLFYKAANGSIYQLNTGGSVGNYFGTVNANNTLLVADTTGDVLGIIPGNNITIVGDAVNDTLTIGLKDDVTFTGRVYVNNSQGAGGTDEGGEIQLANATANSILSGSISIDIYQNKLRFFETNSPNRGAFINLASASTGVGTDLLAAASAVDATARNTANAAFNKANSALANTDGVIFNGTLTATSNLVADRVFSTNNGNGENFKVGDDAWIGDTNIANTLRIKGQQNTQHGYISFGTQDARLLGRAGDQNLTWDGFTVWTANTDGAGSGLDADLLDGQHASFYATATNAAAAFAMANTGNNFLGLADTPSSYANANGYFVVVNPTETGLAFTPDINLDELIFTSRTAPNTPSPDSITVYVTASGTTPNREVAFKIKNESGEEIILSSVLE